MLATTLSLVVIFLPVAFMTGYARRFINPFGWTMAFSILVSMLVSFTLTPMLSARFLKVADAAKDHKTKEGGFFRALDRWYTRSLNWRSITRRHRRHRPGGFPDDVSVERVVGRTFVPTDDMGEWTVHLDAPEGTSLEGSTAIALGLVRS